METSYLYIGQIIYGRNNIYEESLLKQFEEKNIHLEIISVNKSKPKFDETESDKLNNKKIKVLHSLKKLFIDGWFRYFEMIFLGIKWCLKNKSREKVIITLSAPIEVNCAIKTLDKFFSVKSVSLIIDTAMGNIPNNSLINKYVRKCYQITEKLYKYMSASMALNKNVFKYLNLEDKPCLHTRIGHDLEDACYEYKTSRKKTKIIVYTGTLIYYDGTKELLQAMSLLNPDDYILHIYGTGPEENLVMDYQQKYPNIKYMGYLPNKDMKQVMKDADLLVNPRTDNKYTDIFGFPSKMIEYLLSGTPVLTTEFAAMPEEYKDFVYIIKEQTGEGIAEAIKNVFAEEEIQRENKCKKAYDYIYHNNKYEDIVEEIINFISEI